MQVPEKLSLIGGSILLASTLVFTLKGQASSILPKIDSGMSTLMKSDKERQDDQQKQQQEQAFDNNFQQAQQEGWQTGQWGSAKFYVDNQNTMHVGSGQLNGSFSNVVNDKQIKVINLDENIQAPQDSNFLFADSEKKPIPLNQINDLSNLNTSQTTSMNSMFRLDNSLSNIDVSQFDTHNVTNMGNMFAADINLISLDVSNFDTSNVMDMSNMFYADILLNSLDLNHFNTSHVDNIGGMFEEDDNLSSLDLSNFDTSHVTNMSETFLGDGSLSSLDLSNFDTSHVNDTSFMFLQDNVHRVILGQNAKFHNNPNTDLNGIYRNDKQALSLDGNAHPGTWIKQ